MQNPNFRPFRDRVLIRPTEEPDSKIKLSSSDKAKPESGVIVAAGLGAITDSGITLPMTHSVGDTVYFGKYAGSDIELDGETFRIMSESEILGMAPTGTTA